MNSLTERLVRHPVTGAVLVALASFAVYVRTMLPGIGFIDSGELAAVVHTLGIAHPTGYPLFTLLGWLMAHVPVGPDEAWRLNVMAALFCSSALVFLFLFTRTVLGMPGAFRQARRELLLPATAGGMLMLAFSRTWWMQALAVEVYALHVLLVAIVLWLVATARVEGGRWWLGAAYVLGLSFTNHMSTIFLVPGVLYVYGTAAGSWRGFGKGLVRLLPVFLLGLSVYLYLPLRAGASPLLNWGDPSTWERFLAHLSGWQYRVWIFSSTDVAMKNLTAFITGFPGEFAVAGALLALPGVAALLRASRQMAYGTLLWFIVCVLYAANYDIQDLDSYFLLAYVCVGIWSAAGLLVLGSWLAGSAGVPLRAVMVAVVAAGALPAAVHYDAVDQSGNHLVDDYTRNVFASVAPGGVIFSFQWDYWVSASYYYQFVRGERPDILVIDKELLRRSWYLKELEGRAPAFMARCAGEVDAFRREVDKFERGLPYVGAVIEARYVGMIRAMVARAMEARPVYVTPEIEGEFTAGLQRVPEGLVMRLVAGEGYRPPPLPEFRYRPFPRQGRLEDMVRRLYGEAMLARGDYSMVVGDEKGAKLAYERGFLYDPGSVVLRSRLGGGRR